MLSDEQIGRIFDGESPIRVIREHRGLTVRELARLAGMRPDQLARVEKGVAPRPDRLQRIADALGVDVITLRSCAQAEGPFADCGRLLRSVDDD